MRKETGLTALPLTAGSYAQCNTPGKRKRYARCNLILGAVSACAAEGF